MDVRYIMRPVASSVRPVATACLVPSQRHATDAFRVTIPGYYNRRSFRFYTRVMHYNGKKKSFERLQSG